MDLPIKLEQESFVDNYEEIKQTLIQLLTEEKRTFLQGADVGAVSVIHTNMSYIATDSYITDVCSQVPGVQLKSVQKYTRTISGESIGFIDVVITYMGTPNTITLRDTKWS